MPARPTDLPPMPGRAWAVLQFPLTRIVVALVPMVVVLVATELAISALGIDFFGLLGSLLVLASSGVIAVIYRALVHRIERRPLVELDATRLGHELGAGFALGAALSVTTMTVLRLAGVATIGPGNGVAAVIPSLLFAAAAGIAEEILVRGVVFRIIEERLGSWIALAISAAIFGGGHLLNANASATSALAVALEAGVLLGAAFMASRRLWLPIALHAGWNFLQSGVFGVSRPPHGVWTTRFDGPALLTGGDYGPDRSIVAVIVCLALAVGLLAFAHRRGRITGPRWAKPGRWVPL